MYHYVEIYMLGQIILAVILGAVLGWQRERWGKQAGPRTYALVCGGSALFTILSLNAFGNNVAGVASMVVSGIGFLGAGMILHKENQIEGLTTAAGIWSVAAIGMAVGVSYFILAVGAAALILLVLAINDQKFKKKKDDEIIE